MSELFTTTIKVLQRQQLKTTTTTVTTTTTSITLQVVVWMVDSVLASWTDAIENAHEDVLGDLNSSAAAGLVDSDVSSEEADSCSDPEASFLADADFAVAVARAAELSGMTVVGSTVHDPNAAQLREKGALVGSCLSRAFGIIFRCFLSIERFWNLDFNECHSVLERD